MPDGPSHSCTTESVQPMKETPTLGMVGVWRMMP